MNTNTFADLGLPANLVSSLEAAGFTTPTPIQAQAIPAQLEGRDILGIAQTGSGKTAAFALPILTALLERQGRPEPKTASALILAPTRELAVQIEEMLRAYIGRSRLSMALVLGGVSRSAQVNKLARGVDIVIATPGRLSDLVSDRKLRLDKTQFLVLDEADRMLDMGFIKPVRQIAAACAKQRRTALFSATMAPEVAKLAASLLDNPVRVEAAPQGTTVSTVEQKVIFTPSQKKRDQLNALLADRGLSRVIVFARTKYGADKVAKNLAIDGHTVAAIHGNKSQNARQNALRGFRAGKVRVLVATDIASRGIDVPDISHVINYELPDDAENYVHRIGRTGRNGAGGIAIALVDGAERSKLRDIERLIRIKLPTSGDVPTGDHAAAPAQRQARPHSGAPGKPKRGGANRSRRPGGNNGAPSGKKEWWSKLDGEAPHDAAARPKQGGAKKPRWNKRKKDAARTRGAKSQTPRFGDSVGAA
jgi:ATP-dependent RNA helicase RhlE